MPESGQATPRRPPAPVLVAAVIVFALATWFLLRVYTNVGAQECRELYAAARTAADTAGIDTTVTAGSRRQSEPRTCGFMRRTARWQ